MDGPWRGTQPGEASGSVEGAGVDEAPGSAEVDWVVVGVGGGGGVDVERVDRR